MRDAQTLKVAAAWTAFLTVFAVCLGIWVMAVEAIFGLCRLLAG